MHALVVAHYHSSGGLRTDTTRLLECALEKFDRVYLISTKLNESALEFIPKYVTTRIRENIGYDFWSYREGLIDLASQSFSGTIMVMNTSFLCLTPDKFFEKSGSHSHLPFSGAVLSHEEMPHLQSWALQFGTELTGRREFLDWWRNMIPLSDRYLVKHQYEIGISTFLVKLGYPLSSWLRYAPSTEANAAKWNPSHHDWDHLWRELGVIKIELLKDNPFRQNLTELIQCAQRDRYLQALLFEALAN